MAELTEQEWLSKIETMPHIEMARLYRFSPAGHPCFMSGSVVCIAFGKRFKLLGGFTPTISKEIGWEG